MEVPIKTTSSETDYPECLKSLAPGAADFGLVNSAGQSASVIAVSARWALGFQQAVVEVIRSGEIARSNVDLNEQDEKGYSAAMIAAKGGYLETFKLLIDAGADLNLQNKRGQTVLDSPVEFYGTLHQAAQHGPTDFVHTLISRGGECDIANAGHETTLLFTRKSGIKNDAENLILEELARRCESGKEARKNAVEDLHKPTIQTNIQTNTKTKRKID
ncbi:hypothetical protein EV1_021113 [Malus domestica]